MNIISNFLSFMPKPIELSRWKKERTLKIYQFYIKPTVSEWMGSADLTVFKSQMWREKKTCRWHEMQISIKKSTRLTNNIS